MSGELTALNWGPNLGLTGGPSPERIHAPPYQNSECTFSVIGVAFDPAALRPVLPAGINPTPECTGGFQIYEPQRGSLGHFSCVKIWLDVVGYDAPDGSKGRFILHASYSGGGLAATDYYRWRMIGPGSGAQHRNGDLVIADGRIGDERALRMVLRPGVTRQPASTGVHNWLGEDPFGSLCFVSTAFLFEAWPAEPIALDVGTSNNQYLNRLRPKQLLWGAYFTDAVFTQTAGYPVADHPARSEGDSRQLLAALLDRLGTAAAILEPDGTVTLANGAFNETLGESLQVIGGRLRGTTGVERALDKALSAADSSMADRGPLVTAINRPNGEGPLLARFVGLRSGGPGANGRARVLALLDAPERAPAPDPSAALQVFGLTPAEARVATLVGSGVSPKEVARRIGNTEGTVRTTINRIFAKLGLSRQGELVAFVARLSSLHLKSGGPATPTTERQ